MGGWSPTPSGSAPPCPPTLRPSPTPICATASTCAPSSRTAGEFATAAGQAARLAEPGSARWVVTDGDLVIGRADLSGIVLGPFRSASLGYWIDAGYVGRGLARRAVREVCRAARDELGLHRLDAGTLLDNHASQRVLAACGFERYGTAPEYLHINGRWRDHHLFQRILHDGPPACP